jgi:uncharacterized protein YwgA
MISPEILGGLLKRAYPDFNMVLFDNRLKVQKYIYLMQRFGLNLGYSFSLYIRGPYCTELTKDAFQMKNYESIQPIGFAAPIHETRFKEFLIFFEPHKDDTVWLEVASSILIFYDMYSKKRDIVVELVKNKNDILKEKINEIEKVWSELVGVGILNG